MATLKEKLIAKRNDFVSYVADAAGHFLITRKRDSLNYVSAGLSATVVDIPVTQQQSGSIFMVNAVAAASTITLPAHKDGLHYKFVCTEDSGTFALTIAGVTVGNIFMVSSKAAAVGSSGIVILADKFIEGDHIEMFSYGGKWHVTGHLVTGTSFTVS